MLHGLGGGHLAFSPQVEVLASSGYRAVAWDMPGYGHSPPIEPYTFKGLAERCIALVEGLQCGTVSLVGQGIGGMVAQEVVARRPELVDKLLLSGTTAAFELPAGQTWDAVARHYIAHHTALLDAGKGMAELAQWLVPQQVGPGSLPEGVRLASHCMSLVPPATWRRAVEAVTGFDRRSSLAAIRVPTLVLAGEFDRDTPPAAMQAMAQAIPGSTYLEMAGMGHLLNLEAPEEFDGALLNFLALPRRLH